MLDQRIPGAPLSDVEREHLQSHASALSNERLVQTWMDLSTLVQQEATGRARHLANVHKVVSTVVARRFFPTEFSDGLAVMEEYAA